MENNFRSDRLLSYIVQEKRALVLATITGLIYNVGMTAGPYFEGQMAQCLADIFGGSRGFAAMAELALIYVGIVGIVQAARAGKRLYVRVFANDISRNMRLMLYRSLLGQPLQHISAAETGRIMTKAVGDVDICTEGVRKFTTELFDTGVVMVSYLIFLLAYDPRLTLYACVFLPVAYVVAYHVRRGVSRASLLARTAEGELTSATMDRIEHALTWRLNGYEERRNTVYEKHLTKYEKTSVRAGLWENSMQPLYRILSLIGTLPIFFLGGGYVLSGKWDIAAFTAFFACFLRLAEKSSHAAKLFNAVQKAQVSWARVKPLLKPVETLPLRQADQAPVTLAADGLSIQREGRTILKDGSFTLRPGGILAVAGPVACGKSSLGQAIAGLLPYTGHLTVTIEDRHDESREACGNSGCFELVELPEQRRRELVTILGHEPCFFTGTIRDNLCLGKEIDAWYYLHLAAFDAEVRAMPDGLDTRILGDGSPLSGGQQQRLALARTLAHAGSILVLDDPFAALDRETEQIVFSRLREWQGTRSIVLISHRLAMFSQCEQVLYLRDARAISGNYEAMMQDCQPFAAQAAEQAGKGGAQNDM